MNASLSERQFADAAGRIWTLPPRKRREFIETGNTIAEMLATKHDDAEVVRQLPRYLALVVTTPERDARGVNEEEFLATTEDAPQIEAIRKATHAAYGWLLAGFKAN